jgi:hypothetical protein
VCATTLDGTLEMSLVSLQAYMTICANGVWSMVIYPKFMGLITIPQRAQFTHVLAMEHGAVQKGYGAQKKCRSNENHDDNPLELGGTLFFFWTAPHKTNPAIPCIFLALLRHLL